jgi:citrate lyase subunit beta-like protein
MRSRKAFLYVPGSDLHKIQKAAASGADCVVLDLEDGVTEASKTEARPIIARALRELDFGVSERVVRVNGYPSGRTGEDLAAILPAHPDGLLLPKVDGVTQIQRIDESIRQAEKSFGWQEGSITLLAIVESALGMVNLEAICRQSETIPRLQGLVFGAEDFIADMGAERTPDALELLYARSRLVMYATAFGLQAIDLVTVNFKEREVLEREALQGAQLGYSGKQVIHPAQIVPVQQVFTPSEQEIAAATRILAEASRYAEAGKGAFSLDGQMVDRPVIKRAESILARAEFSKGK